VLVAAAARPADSLPSTTTTSRSVPTASDCAHLEKAGLKRVRVDQHEDPAERVVRGNAVRQGQEGLEPSLLAAAVELDILPALRADDHRADRDHQDVDQLMVASARLARILKPGEA
jgi:hypothetical protein